MTSPQAAIGSGPKNTVAKFGAALLLCLAIVSTIGVTPAHAYTTGWDSYSSSRQGYYSGYTTRITSRLAATARWDAGWTNRVTITSGWGQAYNGYGSGCVFVNVSAVKIIGGSVSASGSGVSLGAGVGSTSDGWFYKCAGYGAYPWINLAGIELQTSTAFFTMTIKTCWAAAPSYPRINCTQDTHWS
jgi:hypothetical protein